PGHGEDPLEPATDHPVLGRDVRDALQTREFALGLLTDLVGQGKLLQLFANLPDLPLLRLSQLLLDGAQALAKHVFLLRLRNADLRLLRDPLLEFRSEEHTSELQSREN